MHSDLTPVFSDLPVEVLQKVCSQLCSHCTGIDGPDEAPCMEALNALSRTSRSLCAVAQPVLYHHIRGNLLFKVICTLNERPDLTAYVRRYTQDSRFRFYMEREDEPEFSLIKNIARKLGVYETDDRYIATWNNAPWTETLLIQILIAMATNLETLYLLVDNSGSFDITRFDELSNKFKVPGDPGLPNLRHVQFGTDWKWGLDLSSPAVGTILQASPNLQQLVFRYSSALSRIPQAHYALMAQYPSLPHLRALEFQNCAFNDDEHSLQFLGQFVENSPQLEHFRIHCQSMYIGQHVTSHLPANRVLEILMPRHESLKSLDINLMESSLDTNDDNKSVIVDPEVLHKFTSLKTLKLGEESFCLHHSDPQLTSGTCLSSTVPKSVESLVVRIITNGYVWKDVAELALQAKAERFPNLKRVTACVVLGPMRESKRLQFQQQVAENTQHLRESYESSQVCLLVEEQKEPSNACEDDVLGAV